LALSSQKRGEEGGENCFYVPTNIGKKKKDFHCWLPERKNNTITKEKEGDDEGKSRAPNQRKKEKRKKEPYQYPPSSKKARVAQSQIEKIP